MTIILFFLIAPFAIFAPHTWFWPLVGLGGVRHMLMNHQWLRLWWQIHQSSFKQTLMILFGGIGLFAAIDWFFHGTYYGLIHGTKIVGLFLFFDPIMNYWAYLRHHHLSLDASSRTLAQVFFLGFLVAVGVVMVRAHWGQDLMDLLNLKNTHSPKTQQSIRMGWSILSMIIWPFWHTLYYLDKNISVKDKVRQCVISLSLFMTLGFFSFTRYIDSDTAGIGFIFGGIVYSFACLGSSFRCFIKNFITCLSLTLPALFVLTMTQINTNAIRWMNYNLTDNYSYIDRMYIWNDLAKEGVHHIMVGHGVGSAKHHEQLYGKKTARIAELSKPGILLQTSCGLVHPHNYAIEIFYELGVIGISLFSLALWWICRRLSQLPEKDWGVYLAILVSAQALIGLNSSLWHYWWIASLIIGLEIAHMISMTTYTLGRKNDKKKI